jgi:DNA-binding XRE family transcriptional regulator
MGKETEASAMLRALREELGLSQADMAAAIGVPPRTYQRHETGETIKVPARVLMRAQAFAAKARKK